MGNKVVTPTGPSSGPTASLKDTTLRSILFNKKEVSVVKNAEGQMILAEQVDSQLFDSYVHTLKIMAQLSRLVYCDSSIIREVILSPEFATADNKAVNNRITEFDNKYSGDRRTPSSSPKSKDGRPMVSYIKPESMQTGPGMATYISSPSDLTCLLMKGTQFQPKNPVFTDTDLVIVFKGSSTVKNFKHDLYSQFTATDLATILPPGTTAASGQIGNVPSSFINPLLKSWTVLSEHINKHNPARLFITGHSLGGAYASLFAFMLCEIRSSFPSVQSIHLVSFGCPTILADKARNTFNKHLDSGFITLDRVVSSGAMSRIADVIPSIPVGFSHPGFQPLKTELQPEKNTGRAYNIETIRKVFQKGGVLGIGNEKAQYEMETKIHMPNKISIPAVTAAGNGFAHAEYFDMTWINAFRLLGMKNPGFSGNTFVAELFNDGINFDYVSADASDQAVEDPVDQTANMPTSGGRRTYRKRGKKMNKRKTRKNK